MRKHTKISLALAPAALSLAFLLAAPSPAEAGDRFDRYHNGERHRGRHFDGRGNHKRDRFEHRRNTARDRFYERQDRRLRKHGNYDKYRRNIDRFERRDALKRDRFYKRQARKRARHDRVLDRRWDRRHDRYDRRYDRHDRRWDRRYDRHDRRFDRRIRRQARRIHNHYHGNRFYGDRNVWDRVYRPLGYIFSGFYDDCY